MKKINLLPGFFLILLLSSQAEAASAVAAAEIYLDTLSFEFKGEAHFYNPFPSSPKEVLVIDNTEKGFKKTSTQVAATAATQDGAPMDLHLGEFENIFYQHKSPQWFYAMSELEVTVKIDYMIFAEIQDSYDSSVKDLYDQEAFASPAVTLFMFHNRLENGVTVSSVPLTKAEAAVSLSETKGSFLFQQKGTLQLTELFQKSDWGAFQIDLAVAAGSTSEKPPVPEPGTLFLLSLFLPVVVRVKSREF